MAKAAARDYKTKRRKSSGFSGWMGVICGLAVGLGVAGIVYIKDHRPDAAIARTSKADKKKSHSSEPDDAIAKHAVEAGSHDVAVFCCHLRRR